MMYAGGHLPASGGTHARACLPTAGDASALAECPNYWLPRADIEARRCATAAEQAIVHLYRACLRQLLPERWGGAEFWVQRYDAGRGLGFVSTFAPLHRACGGCSGLPAPL